MPLVFQDYRGYDISDTIQAMKLDENNIKDFADTIRETNDLVKLGERYGMPQLTWIVGRVHYNCRPGDYVIQDPADGYLPIAGHVFEKSFARDN